MQAGLGKARPGRPQSGTCRRHFDPSMLKTCVLGPLNGYYLALYPLPIGPLGEQYLCHYKLFDRQPGDFLDPGPLQEGASEQPVGSIHVALDQGAVLAVREARALPAGPAGMAAEGT